TIDSQGRIVAAGRKFNNDTHLILRRFLPAGGFDLDKADATPDDLATGVVVDAADNIYVSGRENVKDTSGIIAGTAMLTRWTADGLTRSWTARIANKSTCGTVGYYTNGWSVALDDAGQPWFLGQQCDSVPFLRKHAAATGAQLLNADYP